MHRCLDNFAIVNMDIFDQTSGIGGTRGVTAKDEGTAIGIDDISAEFHVAADRSNILPALVKERRYRIAGVVHTKCIVLAVKEAILNQKSARVVAINGICVEA